MDLQQKKIRKTSYICDKCRKKIVIYYESKGKLEIVHPQICEKCMGKLYNRLVKLDKCAVK